MISMACTGPGYEVIELNPCKSTAYEGFLFIYCNIAETNQRKNRNQSHLRRLAPIFYSIISECLFAFPTCENQVYTE